MAGLIKGIVIDAVTKKIIPTGIVNAVNYTQPTCQNGTYTLGTPGAASVTLYASAPGYVTSPQVAVVVADGATKTQNFSLNK